MSDGVRAVVMGASGFGGGELLRLLSGHPEVGAVRALSRHHAGEPVWKAHPHLRGLYDARFDAAPDWRWLADAPRPVVFAALSHGELAGQLAGLEAAWAEAGLAERVTLVDLSSDFRLQDAARYREAYGKAHPAPELLPRFVYGLTELHRAALPGARRIANPGCFATAVQLALAPVAQLPGLGMVAVSGMTGSSGSGTLPGEGTHHPTRAHDLRAYKPLVHQHDAEVEALLAGGSARLAFVPHSAPLVRGIHVTAQFEWPEAAGPVSEAALRERFAAFYAGARFVRLVEGLPRVAAVAGSNFCDIGVAVRGRSVAVMSVIDNLVKGMAGQALQNLNVALGFPEDAGLRQAALYP